MSDARPVLALDLSTHCGVAVGCAGARPAWWTWHLGRMVDGLGRLCSCLGCELEEAISIHKPKRVVFETPIAKAQTTARMLIYLCGVVEMVCYEREVPCFEAASGTARKLVLGHGRPVSRDPKKPKLPMIEWCASQGWEVADDNQADALVLLEYAHRIMRQ